MILEESNMSASDFFRRFDELKTENEELKKALEQKNLYAELGRLTFEHIKNYQYTDIQRNFPEIFKIVQKIRESEAEDDRRI